MQRRDQLHPLGHGEEGDFLRSRARRPGAVEEARAAADDVEVSVRQRIERAGVDGDAHAREMVADEGVESLIVNILTIKARRTYTGMHSRESATEVDRR